MSSERKHREEIVRYGRTLHERGLVAAMDGNLSVRLKDEQILVTPTCVSKGNMRSADMVVVDMEGQRVSGRRNVTSEIGMHLLIYRMRPDIQAIVHAHPPTATGFAAAGIALPAAQNTPLPNAIGQSAAVPIDIRSLSLGTLTRENLGALYGPFPPSLESSTGVHIGGIISHAFFRPYAITFDFVRMKLVVRKPQI